MEGRPLTPSCLFRLVPLLHGIRPSLLLLDIDVDDTLGGVWHRGCEVLHGCHVSLGGFVLGLSTLIQVVNWGILGNKHIQCRSVASGHTLAGRAHLNTMVSFYTVILE